MGASVASANGFCYATSYIILMSRNNSNILQLFFPSGELLVDVFLQKCLLVYMAVGIFFGGACNGRSHSKCRYEASDSNIRL